MNPRTLAIAGLLLAGCATTQEVAAPERLDPLEAMADERPEVRVAALHQPAEPAVAAELVARAAADAHPEVRLAAATAATRLAGRLAPQQAASLADAIARTFAVEGDADVRLAQVRALGRLGGQADSLLVAAASEDGPLRIEALHALGRTPPASRAERAAALAAAASHVGDEDPAVRAAAAYLLASLGDEATSEWIASLARDADPTVRALAARGLGQVAENPSLLEALLGDPVVAVRVEAAHALAAAADGGSLYGLAIDRAASSLAHRLAAGDRGMVQPLSILAPHVRTLTVRARVTEALQARDGVVPARAIAAAPGVLELRTAGGVVLVALDPGASEAAMGRLEQAIASGLPQAGAQLAQPEVGRMVVLPLVGGPAETTPPGERVAPSAGASGGRWERGTFGLDPAGRWILALGRNPALDGIGTPMGRVIQGMEVLETLRPGAALSGVVLH